MQRVISHYVQEAVIDCANSNIYCNNQVGSSSIHDKHSIFIAIASVMYSKLQVVAI